MVLSPVLGLWHCDVWVKSREESGFCFLWLKPGLRFISDHSGDTLGLLVAIDLLVGSISSVLRCLTGSCTEDGMRPVVLEHGWGAV